MSTTFVRFAIALSIPVVMVACDVESEPTAVVVPEALEPSSSHTGGDLEGQWTVGSYSVGKATACAIDRSSGIAACWGRNDHGQLGIGHRRSRSVPVPISHTKRWGQIATGESHTCAIRSDGAAYCWGANHRGQLGDGTTTERLRPVRVAGGHTFTSIDVGIDHTCAWGDNAGTYCWGDNSRGQLGSRSRLGSFLRTPVLVSGGRDFFAVFLGDDRTCGLEDDTSNVYCWGINRSTGTQSSTPTRVAGAAPMRQLLVTGLNTCGIASSGFDLYCWGGEGNAHPTPELLGTGYQGLSDHLLCAINRVDNAVHCWDGSYDPVPVHEGILWNSLRGGFRMNGDQVFNGTICTTRVDWHDLFCWGDGNLGQIGYGGTEDQSAPTAVLRPAI